MAKKSTAAVHPTTGIAGREPLPHAYWWFFQIIEPLLTFGGAFFAMFQPAKYAADLLPPEIERLTRIMGETSRGGIVIGTLGSCFFLIGLTECSLVWTVTHHVTSLAAQEKIFRAFMISLCLADWTHITLTLLPLPMSHLQSPAQWTYLLHGNATLTFTAFLIRQVGRCAWLLGIARPPLSAETAHEPLPVPRSPQRSTRAETHPASPTTPAKALAAEGGEVEEREKEKAKGSVRRRARGT